MGTTHSSNENDTSILLESIKTHTPSKRDIENKISNKHDEISFKRLKRVMTPRKLYLYYSETYKCMRLNLNLIGTSKESFLRISKLPEFKQFNLEFLGTLCNYIIFEAILEEGSNLKKQFDIYLKNTHLYYDCKRKEALKHINRRIKKGKTIYHQFAGRDDPILSRAVEYFYTFEDLVSVVSVQVCDCHSEDCLKWTVIPKN